MKSIFILLALVSTTTFASPTNTQKICDSLYKKAINNCEVSMCEDSLKEQGSPVTKKNIDNCLKTAGGDLLEGAQICVIDGGELEALIKDYNLKNPKNKISCEN